MKNPNIAKMLKYYRKCNRLSVAEVSEKLEAISPISVAVKTIYGWESGQTQPDADMLLRLCKIYHIDNILSAFGYVSEEERLSLSTVERNLILNYREKPELQSAINMLLGVEDADAASLPKPEIKNLDDPADHSGSHLPTDKK